MKDSRPLRKKESKRIVLVLLLSPLLVPLALLVSSHFQTRPLFKAPPEASVVVSQSNPFSRYAGPIYFERLASPLPPQQLWQQMRGVFNNSKDVHVDADIKSMNANYLEVREHRQASFKVLGVPQMSMYSPRFRNSGTIKNANMQLFLGADGRGGSILEIWVMDKF